MVPAPFELRDLLHAELVDSGFVRSCLNCEAFDLARGYCLEYEATPPAKTVVFSCKVRWHQQIPF